jgi:hypothetical protein
MPGVPKTVEIFGVRPLVWVSMAVAAAGLVFLFRIVGNEPADDSRLQQVPVDPAPAPAVREARLPANPAEFHAESVILATDGRENEPLSVLINELHSPDPETRMAAAMRLSRRGQRASEAVPVLKQLAQDERDSKVREVMNEAILNIRGFVPAPFEGFPKN